MRDRIKTKGQLIEELADMRRRVTELEASEAEARWRSLVDVVRDPMVTADVKDVITWCNGQAVMHTEYSREEIIGTHFSELGFLWARDLPEYPVLVESILRGDVAVQGQE